MPLMSTGWRTLPWRHHADHLCRAPRDILMVVPSCGLNRGCTYVYTCV